MFITNTPNGKQRVWRCANAKKNVEGRAILAELLLIDHRIFFLMIFFT